MYKKKKIKKNEKRFCEVTLHSDLNCNCGLSFPDWCLIISVIKNMKAVVRVKRMDVIHVIHCSMAFIHFSMCFGVGWVLAHVLFCI